MDSKTVRTFTVSEANKLLPRVSKTLKNAFVLHQRVKSLTVDIEDLLSIWGKDVLDKSNMDNSYYLEKITERERLFNSVGEIINEVQKSGCVVKDLDKGLVDFYCERNGDLVFLCWKYGERKITHWHPVRSGYGSRMKLNS